MEYNKIAVYSTQSPGNMRHENLNALCNPRSFNLVTEYSKYIEEIDDIDEFNDSKLYKLAICNITDYSRGMNRDVPSLLNLLKDADKVIAFSSELDSSITSILNEFDYDNFEFHLPGIVNQEVKFAKIVFYPFWFLEAIGFYLRRHLYLLEELRPFAPKEKYFEYLPGCQNFQRDEIRRRMCTLNKNGDFLIAPFLRTTGSYSDGIQYAPNQFREDDIKVLKNGSHIEYKGESALWQSQIIPLKVYNRSAYSIVSESFVDNEMSFFTEKIVKPLISNRLFVVFSGQYYLRNLRSLGFKTFEGIIDESYDEEPYMQTRWAMIENEIEKLLEQDQNEVLRKCSDIFFHNRRILLNMTHFPKQDNFKVNYLDSIEHSIEKCLIDNVKYL